MSRKSERAKIYTSSSALPSGTKKIDALPGALTELFFIQHPALRPNMPGVPERVRAYAKGWKGKSVWAYYPWRKAAIRIPDETTYFTLRTARNRDLITKHEQAAYRRAVVGVAGLSVGSAALAALVSTGGPKRLKIADPDTLEITNLNRLKAVLPDIGENKTDIAARAALERDPFLELQAWQKGLSRDTLKKFVSGAPKLTVFVDEMDDIELKILSRIECRTARVPVVMATDNGEGCILDVERFDREPNRPLFHGRVSLDPARMQGLNRAQFIAMAKKIIDPKLLAPRQAASLARIGKSLAGVAQLGSAADIAGAAVAYAVRRIAAGQSMPSGRYVISPENALSKKNARG